MSRTSVTPPVQLGKDVGWKWVNIFPWKCPVCGRITKGDETMCECKYTREVVIPMQSPFDVIERKGEPLVLEETGSLPPAGVPLSFGGLLDSVETGSLETKAPAKWSTRLEGGCPACVAKHLSQAIIALEILHEENQDAARPSRVEVNLFRACILASEVDAGYRGHKFLAAGCLAAAEEHLRRENIRGDADAVRSLRLDYLAGKSGPLEPAVEDRIFSRVPITLTPARLTKAWSMAHVVEAIAELPACDFENRKALNAVYAGMPRSVVALTRVLKNVVELYELENK